MASIQDPVVWMETETLIRLGAFLGVFAILAAGEIFLPRRRLTTSKGRRWLANLRQPPKPNLGNEEMLAVGELFEVYLNRLKRMPDADRQLYERRYHQWKGLPPEERRRLLQKLDRWESLPPEEQEAIRRRFRNQ